MHHALITDLGVAIIIAAAMTALMHFLRQPLILGYLVAGIVIGPHMTPQLVTDVQNIDTISEIGLVLLLFIIGLELNPHNLLAHGRALAITGGLQFPINLALAMLVISLAAGFALPKLSPLEPLYLAVFCSLSSTAIVVKSLYDKFELESLAGRLSVGVLIFQDLWAIFFLVLQPNLDDPRFALIAIAFGKAVALLAAGFLFSKYVLSALFNAIARNPELVVTHAIGWCALLASVASALDLSLEMGALIAGFAISVFPYHIHITARVAPLRDFFMTLFFISLGMKIPTPRPDFAGPLLLLLLTVILSKLVVIPPLVRLSRGGLRTGILTALNLGQVSEFSLVIAAVAAKSGHISAELMSVLVYALGISAITSTYTIKYNRAIYRALRHLLQWLPFVRLADEAEFSGTQNNAVPPVFILGFHRGARAIVDELRETNPDLLSQIRVIDYNVEVLRSLSGYGIEGIFGDISSVETLRYCGTDKARLIISTVPDFLLKGTNNQRLVRACRELAPEAIILATAEIPEQAIHLEEAGADYVALPYSLVGKTLAAQISAIAAADFELNEPIGETA